MKMRIMKLMKVVGISFLILILASFTIPSCQATIEKEYIEYYESDYFAFKVKIIIETERDGTWIQDVTYWISLFVTFTQMDDTLVGLLKIYEMDIKAPVIVESLSIVYPTYFYHVGQTISHEFYINSTFHNIIPERFNLQPRFRYNYTRKSSPDYDVSREWEADEPLYVYLVDPATDVVSRVNSIENQLSTITGLMYALIVTTIILIATTGYLAIQKITEPNSSEKEI